MINKKIVITIACVIVGIFLFLHIQNYIKTAKKENIQQDDFYKSEKIQENAKNEKNIYIIRFYSNLEEQKKILKNIENVNIKSYNIKTNRESKIPLGSIISGMKPPENTRFYMLHQVNKDKVPVLDEVYSQLSISKNIYIHTGYKLDTYPLVITHYYDRLFFHVLTGAIQLTIWHPKQDKYMYLSNKQQKGLKNNSTAFRNCGFELDNFNETKYKKLKKANSTSIILREGNLIYIPNFWFFKIHYLENSVGLFYTSTTLISGGYSLLN